MQEPIKVAQAARDIFNLNRTPGEKLRVVADGPAIGGERGPFQRYWACVYTTIEDCIVGLVASRVALLRPVARLQSTGSSPATQPARPISRTGPIGVF